MGIDVLDIIQKGRHPLTAFRTSIVAERQPQVPHRVTKASLHFHIHGDVPDAAVERAIALSRDVLLRLAFSPRRHPARHGVYHRAVSRLPHLDWLRGIAVLIMIEAHTLDSWTRVADGDSPLISGPPSWPGSARPYFLFLAGVALMLAAGSRQRRGLTVSAVTRSALRRGAWILALAFLFRLQSFVISGGTFPRSLLKVDILNIMGVSMLVGSLGLAVAATFTRGCCCSSRPPWRSPWPHRSSGRLRCSRRCRIRWRPTSGRGQASRHSPCFRGPPFSPAGVWLAPGSTRGTATFNERTVWLRNGWGRVGRLCRLISPAALLGGQLLDSSPTFFFLRLGILMTSVRRLRAEPGVER